MSSLSSPEAALPPQVRASAAAHAAVARRRKRLGDLHLVALATVVLGPLVVYPLARLVLLSVSGDLGPSLLITNGRAVVVRINDRGPFNGRAIDLSEAAAREIGMIATGTAEVRIEPI